jgi:hypothetical protein
MRAAIVPAVRSFVVAAAAAVLGAVGSRAAVGGADAAKIPRRPRVSCRDVAVRRQIEHNALLCVATTVAEGPFKPTIRRTSSIRA